MALYAWVNSWVFFFPVLIPLLASMYLMSAGELKEATVVRIALGATTLMGLSSVGAILFSLLEGEKPVHIPVFKWGTFTFVFGLDLDIYSGVFLLVTVFLGGTVMRFSHRYMHREVGHQKFFSSILAFLSGLALLGLAEDLSTFFVGWEILGISSFILIGFYRHRRQPILNSQKVYSVYRICDVGILISAYWVQQGLGDTGFHDLTRPEVLAQVHALGEQTLFPLSMMLLLACIGKSAQFPFLFWVSRAMEGPTPSSAIFYGALSVHAGIFLLIRTYPIWNASVWASWFVGGIGLLTALLSSGISRVQTNIKGQIAYASVAQVGLMFLEVALDFPHLALAHFVSNACFRCYQLLVSPSVVAYLLRRQSTSAGSEKIRFVDRYWQKWIPRRVRDSLYVLFFSEAYLPQLFDEVPSRLFHRFFGGVRLSALSIWTYSSLLGVCVALLSTEGDKEHLTHVLPFLVGVVSWYLLGAVALVLSRRNKLARTKAEKLVFLSLLGLTGFPISPLFFGEDLVLHSAMLNHPIYVFAFGFAFILNGILLIRAYCYEFMLSDALPA